MEDLLTIEAPSWLHYLRKDECATVGYTSRGEVMESDRSPYSSFNLCHYTGDDPGRVKASRQMLARELGIPADAVIVPRQTHSTNVLVISDSVSLDEINVDDIDALVTNRRDIVIGVNTADCLPVVVVDELHGVAGVAHAGWRGAVGGVVLKMMDAMEELGAQPERMTAYLGPAICKECFEVGEEVAMQFPDICVDRSYPKPHVDLPRFAFEQLTARGVAADRIVSDSGELCTKCHADYLFSARKLGIASGRNFTFARLSQG